jgi:hypothetical protein
MNVSPSPIILGILFNKRPDWRSLLASIPESNEPEVGIFLQGVNIEERKEIYRALEASSIKKIPYTQLASDAQEWEIKFFIEKFSTSFFSIPATTSSYQIIDHWPSPAATCLIENPPLGINDPIFTQELMLRPGIKGVCLDTSVLEIKRIRQIKMYQADLAVLDHQEVSCLLVSPVSNSWFGRLFSKPYQLDSLSDLRYLKHFPQKYFSSMIVLQLSNSFEEQLEVKQYLQSVFRGGL